MSVFAATVTGRLVDLTAPEIAPEHLWSEVAHGLSQLARFAGQTATAYSIAQHCVLMAEAAEDETGDPALAAHCLLHDAHEAFLGDKTSPRKRLEEAEFRALAADNAIPDHIVTAWIARWRGDGRRGETRLDRAIWRAAGLAEPDAAMERAIAAYDLRALATEKRDLFSGSKPWPGLPADTEPLPLRAGRIRPWPPGRAFERFSQALGRLCPDAAAVAGRTLEGDAA
ncbi:hypothetical protein [Jiella marina]|uniref:hypothetical protein n=1 Tax=Jiella sp. LLJ827 TaxID=2917712 RepID=UPI002101C5F3|nr:hypothetical protein [Jiella sp. LLJ827]MCQ0986434.1 hypothetical protein [Jiella sp. LLJ827]